jgi:hypothetical protein
MSGVLKGYTYFRVYVYILTFEYIIHMYIHTALPTAKLQEIFYGSADLQFEGIYI